MKPECVGDCYDFYKRSFLAELFPNKQLVAFPMPTKPWRNEHIKSLYSSLVGVKVIQDDLVPDAAERTDYFKIANNPDYMSKDIFFDPDIGLHLNRCSRPRHFDEYLFRDDLEYVLPRGSTRVAVVCDKSISCHKDITYHTKEQLDSFLGIEFSAFVYHAEVAMVVLSRDERRICSLHSRAANLPYLPFDRLLLMTEPSTYLDTHLFLELMVQQGTDVFWATYDGGYPGYSGYAGVIKFADRFWSYSDEGQFGGPYNSLWDAIYHLKLGYGEVSVSVKVTGLSEAEVAKLLDFEAPAGHVVEINGNEWVLGKNGRLSPKNPQPRKQAKHRPKKNKTTPH